MNQLDRSFYQRDTLTVAQELLGKLLVHETPQGRISGRIVETEAYLGPMDAAAHSYRSKKSTRTAVQYGPGGYAYLYLIYGIYYCMNIVTALPGQPEVVLLRALEPVDGIQIMCQRRKTENLRQLCNGPGKLCRALGLGQEHYGEDLCGARLYVVEDGYRLTQDSILTSKRIGIDYAGEAKDYPWRFLIRGCPYVSKPPL